MSVCHGGHVCKGDGVAKNKGVLLKPSSIAKGVGACRSPNSRPPDDMGVPFLQPFSSVLRIPSVPGG